jgi:methyl-accepting chemotaxis protein
MYDVTIGVLDDLLATRVSNFNQRRTVSLGVVSISIVLAALFILSIGRSISSPLAELKEVADRMNKGDLSTPADSDRHDEIGQLAGALNRLQKTLQGGNKMKAA